MVKSKFMLLVVDYKFDLLLVFWVWTNIWDNLINSNYFVPRSTKIFEP
jgi:hypothetical protein